MSARVILDSTFARSLSSAAARSASLSAARAVSLSASCALFSGVTWAQAPSIPTTVRLNVGAGGLQASELGQAQPSISHDGRFVAFQTPDDGLVGAASTGDVLVADRDADQNGVLDDSTVVLKLVSVATGGTKGNSASITPAISGDGRFVAFVSAATNLVTPDANGFPDLFLHDRDPDADGVFDEGNGVTTRVPTWDGGQPNAFHGPLALSFDGRYLAFQSDAWNWIQNDFNGKRDVFRYDRLTSQITLVSANTSGAPSNGDASQPAISADGRFVAFSGAGSDIVPGIGGVDHVFVRDLSAGTTVCADRTASGVLGNGLGLEPSLSADGRFVAFASTARNFDALDTDFNFDVYVKDLQSGALELASLDLFGVNQTGPLARQPKLSADGTSVAFWSNNPLAWNVTGSFCEAFVFDRATKRLEVASRATNGAVPNDHVANFTGFAFSGDGRSVVFDSPASNLVAGDTNGRPDLFAHQRVPNAASEQGFGSVGSNGLVPTLGAWGSLGSGASATVQVVLGPANTRSLLVVSTGAAPKPFFGGTLVPATPASALHPLKTDADGRAQFVLAGGGGPQDLWLQWLVRDPGASQGVGLSNAVKVTLAP
ncbi:MAG: hypothetical protein L6Q99_14550 [Planctomycetes bacterium]|nr:hypothetical protein [Planctomycetota bacterium]